MISWLLIVIIAIAIIAFTKFRHIRSRIWLVVVLVAVIFFYATITSVVNSNKVDINTINGISSAGKLYVSWLGHALENTKVIVGNAIGLDWSTNTTALENLTT